MKLEETRNSRKQLFLEINRTCFNKQNILRKSAFRTFFSAPRFSRKKNKDSWIVTKLDNFK